MLQKQNLRKAAHLTIPIFFGYVSIGIPFGLMVVNAGYPWWLALFMGLTIFSGTGQYVGIGLMAAGASLPTFLITQFFVGIRHIVYGLSLLKKYDKSRVGLWKYFLIFALTDETYALITTNDVPEGEHDGEYYSVIAALNWSYWLLGGLIGALIGSVIPANFSGVDFALNSLFVVLMIEQVKKSRELFPSLCGISTTIISIILCKTGILPDKQVLMVALTLGIAVLIFAKSYLQKKESLKEPENKNKEAE